MTYINKEAGFAVHSWISRQIQLIPRGAVPGGAVFRPKYWIERRLWWAFSRQTVNTLPQSFGKSLPPVRV